MVRRRAAVAFGVALAALAGAAHAQPSPGAPMAEATVPASRAFLIAGVEVAVLVAAIVAGAARTERRAESPPAPAQPPADQPAARSDDPPEDDRKRPAL